MNAEPRMDQWILVVDLDTQQVRAVRPTEKQIQAMADSEDFIIINPLTNQQYIEGSWEAIPSGNVIEFNNIVEVR